jgi:serine/threonine protein kinase
MKAPRWQTIADSEYPWEREAIEWLMERLPDGEPWHAWSNFEFIDDEGKVNEVDVLVLAPAGLFLVEIKSRPGILRGDAHTWTWTNDGREYSYDSPVYLANRKAKRLASLLRKQPSFLKARERMPWVEPAIFLSAKELKCHLDGPARAKTYLRGRPQHPEDDGIVAALHAISNTGALTTQRVDAKQAKAIVRAMAEAGIRPSARHRQVGDYRLGSLLAEGVNYQDWSAKHVSVETKRRIRIYSYSKASTPEARQSLARQAKREFQILEGIDHPGILKVLDYKDTELGPALVFEPENGATRLDHFLQRKHAELDIGQRLQILRDLADTLRYAHTKRLYHRALSPACVLVRETSDVNRPLRLQIVNWQTGARDSTGSNATLHTVGTQHVEDYVEDPSRVYLAPEALQVAPAGMLLDVFALGAIAHFVLSSKPPATDTIELMDKLRRGPGLRLSDALDGAAKHLQDLVSLSTHPDVSARIGSMEEFSEYLELAEDELTAPEPEQWVDPSVAKPGDRIEGGFTSIKWLGRGSSADVVLVKRDANDQELVLKVATDPRYNDRLVDEADTLSKLTHQNIVKYVDTVEVNGRRAILMHKAGETSLARDLREKGKPSLDMLRRFGDELLTVLNYLEEHGVAHRDIKPDNIGIAAIGGTGKKQLVLFDFSLSRTSPDNIQAGTAGYLDPFLRIRKLPRWDLYAERYAATVTLYEMATGALPVWGDSNSAPDMLDCEVTLNTDAFDPNLRDELTAFFAKAFRRDIRERFDNAEEMLRHWRRVFDTARRPDTTPDVFDAVARLATASSTISELGYSVEAQSVLERMGVHNVRELLAVERIKFRYLYLKGVSDKVRKEIRLTAKRLAQMRPDLIPGRPTITGDEEAGAAQSLDELAAQLLPKRPAGDDRTDEQAIALYLGLDSHSDAPGWLSLGKVASAAGVARSAVADALVRMRERWLKSPALTELREEIAALLQTHGNVMTANELAKALLLARGSIEHDESTRMRLGLAVARACIEAEQQRGEPRFQLFELLQPLIATSAELAEFANRLGIAADQLAQQDPLLSPTTVMRELEAVQAPEGVPTLLPQRLLRLAAAASKNAALSSRSEIYPVGMSALQAIRQSLGALSGPQRLTERELHERVRGRFPVCAPLPRHPDLDRVLLEAGLELIWQPASGEHEAGYVPPHVLSLSVGSTTMYHRRPTQTVMPAEVSSDVAAARAFEERISHLLARGGFLALTTMPRLARHLEDELTRRFDVRSVSFDELLLDAMLDQAKALGVEMNVLLEADRSAPTSVDWRNLLRLVSKSAAVVKQMLLQSRQPLLITEPGLLARYDLMSMVNELQAAAGRPSDPPTILLLVSMVRPDAPAIDGVVVPTISAAQWAKVPESWINNEHRSAVAS